MRDRLLVYQMVEASDDRVLGSVTFTLNMNLESASFTGHIWGKYLLEVPGRGSWEGMWEGQAHSATRWTYRVVLFGNGEFEGLQIRANGLWIAGVGDMLDGQIKSAENE